MGEFKDLTGMVFGMLTVIRQVEDYVCPSGRHYKAWLCQCECGSEPKIIKEYSLMDKRWPTTNCGCLKGTSSKKYNKYDLTGEYGIGWTNKGEIFYFDLEDYDKIKNYCWYFDNRYLKARDIKSKNPNKKIRMHRLITNCPDNLEPNYKNYNTLDNRKENLEVVTHKENMMKRRPYKEWNIKQKE